MKAIKIVLAVWVLLSTLSCSTYYRMVVAVDSHGNVNREVYASADSAFLKNGTGENPFMFHIDSGWDITRLDSAVSYDFFGQKGSLNVKATWQSAAIDSYVKEVQYDEQNRSWAVPEESLSQKNGWFYTRYTFTTLYRKIAYEVPVPIENYLTRDEQKLWTQGGWDQYTTLNGVELNDLLSGIESKYMQWYNRNLFEITLSIVKKKIEGHEIPDADKDKLFERIESMDKEEDIHPALLSSILDTFYGTTYFSGLYKANKEDMEQEFDKATSVINQIAVVCSYELEVPGGILHSNATMIKDNQLIWKVDGIRLMFDDYALQAEYRMANTWAFVLTGLLIIIAVGCLILLMRQRRNR